MICANKAFTLSEVLLVLSIIGVIAALTVPTLINKVSKDQNVAKLKKEYSVLSQAYNSIISDAGGSITNNPNFSSSIVTASVSANAMNEFATKLNVIKNCGSGTGCWYTSAVKWLGGGNKSDNIENYWVGSYGKGILADGASILFNINNNLCTASTGLDGTPLANSVCGGVDIDVNGPTGPNTMGRDLFSFWITQTGIYPKGTFGDGRSCELNSTTDTTSSGCTGKVLTEGVMNY